MQWNLFVEATATQRVALESLMNDASGELLRSLCTGDLLLKKRCPPAAAFARASAELVTAINSEHTRKEDTPVTWAQLAALDPEMTAMAQQMALRYARLGRNFVQLEPGFLACFAQPRADPSGYDSRFLFFCVFVAHAIPE